MNHTSRIALLLVLVASTLQAKVVTLTVQNYNGITNETAEVFIESYEVAEVLAHRDNVDLQRTRLTVLKDGAGIELPPAVGTAPFKPVVVAGPARIRLLTVQEFAVGFATIRITPEAYPPDKSILVAPGSGGASISLEWSTNLVNWTSTTNGVYTNLPVAAFFRITADRIP